MKSFVVLSCVLAVAVASYVPADTPEVAAAKAQHLAAHQEALGRNWAGQAVANQWVAAAPSWNAVWAARAGNNWYAPAWNQWAAPVVVNGHVQDTPEVAAEKAKHLSLVAQAQARNGAVAGQWIHSGPVAVAGPASIVVANGHVQDTPEVAAEKAKHFSLVAQAQARNAAAGESEWADNAVNWQAWGAPAAVHTYAAVAPVVSSYSSVAALPAVATVAAGNLQSQYHAQDEAGQYSYGYAGGLSTKNEQRTIDGVTRGAYSYVDANGLIQSRSYVADPVNGFRVAATDLPQGPSPVVAAAPVLAASPVLASGHLIAAASPVIVNADGHLADTPEVAVAKAQHLAAHAQEHVRLAQAEH